MSSPTGMKQRCRVHDYRAPSFYMITLVTRPRRDYLSALSPGPGAGPGTEPAGSVAGAAPDGSVAGAAPAPASLALSPIGKIVQQAWQRTSQIYPGVQACEYVIMPDHFHGILRVKERLNRPVGHIIKAFKRVSTQECRSKGLLLPKSPGPGAGPGTEPAGSVAGAAPDGSVAGAAPAPASPTLWEEGYQDTILLHRGQLKTMVNYIADNPRRLAAKRASPELFTVVQDLQVTANLACPGIGNQFLLDRPVKRQVQISRRILPDILNQKKEELLYSAEHGAVLVSPCISPGEKEIAHKALEAGLPLIVLLENGFRPHYKPPGRYFNACANGHLLMLAPFPYNRRKHKITREQCLALNDWAIMIVNSKPEVSPWPGKPQFTGNPKP